MGFFDKLGAQLTNAGRTVSQNVKNASDSSSLQREISSHQKNIQQKYAEIGQLFYEKYCEAPENEFSEQVASIKTSMQEIVRLQAEIQEVKARKAELVPIPEDTPKNTASAPMAMVCTKCGNTYDSAQAFCSVCGEKLVPQFPTPAQQPVPPTPAPPVETVAVAPETAEPSQDADITPFADDEEIPDEIRNDPKLNFEKNKSVVNLFKDEETSTESDEVEVREIEPAPTHKYCTVCGAENESDSTFCVQCGNALS